MNEDKLAYYLELFDDYLDGKLSEVKTQEIKSALKETPFLNDVLQQHVQARANIRIGAESRLKEKFNKSFDPIAPDTKKKINLTKYLLPLLLAIGLAVFAYYFFNKEQTKLLPELAQVEDPSYNLMRSENTGSNTTSWEQAMTICSKGDYQICLNTLDKIKDEEFITNNSGKFYLIQGVSQLKLKKFAEAQISLSKIISTNPYYDQAMWYKALSYYFADSKSQSIQAFENIIADTKHYKFKEAKRYLEVLKKQ